jgi:hypothetical protein
MDEHANQSKYGRNEGESYQLELVGLASPADRPPLVVQAVGDDGAPLHSQDIGPDGRFDVPADVLKRSSRVLLGAPDGKKGVRADASISYRASEFLAQIDHGKLALAEGIWAGFRFHRVCVSGSVQACRRRPWWFDSLITTATTLAGRASQRASALAPVRALRWSGTTVQERFTPSLNDLVQWPYRCAPVCLGTVEVYRRSCCCWPIVFDDSRIHDLIRDLEIYVERLPKLPPHKPGFPPPPPPPGDPLKTVFFKGGAINELAVNAAADLLALRAMPHEQAAQYINGRAYLFHRLCHCGLPSRVGSGTIQPDGRFNVCWLEPWRLLMPHCYEQYAYVVKQSLGGNSVTIYDGLAAGAWFAAGDAPVLSSYDRNAYTCDQTRGGDGTANVFLDLIGDTESHQLTTPTATGWDRVAMPDAGSGLLFPGVGPGGSHLRNLGRELELTFSFSLGLKEAAVSARYYRVSVCKADANGNPIGDRRYYGQAGGLDPSRSEQLTWQKIQGADIVTDVLGPKTVNGVPYLYRIPFSNDEAWVGSVRHHAVIDTVRAGLDVAGDGPAANHLVTLELFNAACERLRPLGTAASGQSGAEVERPFTFRRWFQPGGSPGDDTAAVPHAALTHLFCWDNREPEAAIERLVKNGSASNEPCQFLEGPNDATFGVQYRAYVPDERFQYAHGIEWRRGLGGTVANGGIGSLPTPLSPANVGKPLAPAGNSDSNTFEQMLTRIDPPDARVLARCSFAATLTTYAKTTDGADLSYPSQQDVAAFALAIE